MTLHALPEELISVLKDWLSSGNLRAAVLRIRPRFSVAEVVSADLLDADVASRGMPFGVCLSPTAFDLAASSLHEFMMRNEPGCIVDIGGVSDEGLEESAITIVANESDAKAFWNRALRDVKAMTRAGLWMVSPVTGARKFSRNSRYTEGAARFAQAGKRLRPLAGWNLFELDEGKGTA